MRSVMRACIGSNRAPDGRYAEIDLPASPYRLLNALDEIGIKSTKEIVYQEILNYGSFGYLEPHFDEYTMLEELNALAQKLAVFDRVDSIAFEGLVKMAEQKPEPFGVKELINFAHSTESCHVVSDVFDDEQLGRFYAGKGFMPEYETLPDKIYEHLDFAKIGGKPGNPKAASLPSEATVVVHGHPTASAVSCGGASIDWITARNTVLTPSRFKKTTSTPPLCEP